MSKYIVGSLKVLGASNHTDVERSKLDYYGTDLRSTKALLENETFDGEIWEPCAGHHMMSNVLEEAGYKVRKSDIFDYGFGDELLDFMKFDGEWNENIITNPPYGISTEFAAKALELLQPGKKLAMFLRLQWLEGAGRYNKIFNINPPKTVYIFVNRQASNKDDDFTVGSAVAYMWMVWEKGFKGDPVIKWISTNKPEESKFAYTSLF